MPQNRPNITGLILFILHSAILQQSISNYSAIVQHSISNYSAIVPQSLSISDPQDFPTILSKCNTLVSRPLSGLHGEFYNILYSGTGWVIELGENLESLTVQQ